MDVIRVGGYLYLLDALIELRGGKESRYRQIESILTSDDGWPESPWAPSPGKPVPRTHDQRRKAIDLILARESPSGERVVWLGYRDFHVDWQVVAGRVEFFSAHWFVPNIRDQKRSDIPRAEELTALLSDGQLFQVASNVNEDDALTVLARVELGRGPFASAIDEAETLAEAIIEMARFQSRGTRPKRTDAVLVGDGRALTRSMGGVSSEPAKFDDYWGRNLTADALAEVGPRVGEALSDADPKGFLAAAIRVYAEASRSRSRSREASLGLERGLEDRTIVALDDQVLEHVASHVHVSPDELVDLMSGEWPHSQWLVEVGVAVNVCFTDAAPPDERDWGRDTMLAIQSGDGTRSLDKVQTKVPELIGLVGEHFEADFVSAMLTSISDPLAYASSLRRHEEAWQLLRARRRRVRNAIVHGNPVDEEVLKSVADVSAFLSRYALQLAVESSALGETVPEMLDRRQATRAEYLLTGVIPSQ